MHKDKDDYNPESRTFVEPETVLDEFFLSDSRVESERVKAKKSLNMPYSTRNVKQDDNYTYVKKKLYRAGFETEPEGFITFNIKLAVLLSVFFTGFAVYTSLSYGYGVGSAVLVALLSLIAGFGVLFSILFALNIFYLNLLIFKRRLEMEKVLPEFLRLVATNIRSGLSLHDALTVSSKKRFGILSKEIELVAKTSKVKGDFAKSLEIFGRKFDSKILQRSMNSISASVKSGTNISGLLEKTADNITKMKNMRLKMAASVKNYIIFIIASGIIIAPLMFSMSFHMNDTVADIKDRVNVDIQSGSNQAIGLSGIGETGGVESGDFDLFAILMIITNVLISSVLIGVIRYGNWRQGLSVIPIYLLLSISLYFGGKLLLANLLGGV